MQVRKSRRLGAKAETKRDSRGLDSPFPQSLTAETMETRSQQAARSVPVTAIPSAPNAPARGPLLGRADKDGMDTLISNVWTSPKMHAPSLSISATMLAQATGTSNLAR